MRFSDWFSSDRRFERYNTHERLFDGLKNQEHYAIVYLQVKAWKSVSKIVDRYGLPADQSDEILNRSTLIFLQKIESGAYQFKGNAPLTYLVEIAKRLALMATRSRQKTTEALDDHTELADLELDAELKRKEAADVVDHLLKGLGSPCQEVIRLHHIDGYADEEVVRLGLTKYTTVDSLKMKRSDCMKKLLQLAQKWKNSKNT